MVWSQSAVNSRNSCPFKFILAHKVAGHNGKPIKRKAFELKNMLNFQMWQGQVVDKVIEEFIIPALKKKKNIDYQEIAEKAVALAKIQFDFSEAGLYKSMSKTSAGSEYCILDVHEISKEYEEQELQEVFQNIRESILNFPKIMLPRRGALEDFLREPGNLIPNVNGWMRFKFQGADVKPQIDLVFEWKKSIFIIDWKVSDSFLLNAQNQLNYCALAAYNHYKSKENPNLARKLKYEDIYLLEVNLLNKELKTYNFNTEIANQALDEINLTHQDLSLTTEGKNWSKIDLSKIPRTQNINTCKMCRLKTLCAHLITNKYEYDEEKYNQYLQNTKFV